MSLSFVPARDRLNKVPLKYSGEPIRPPVALAVLRPEGHHSKVFPLDYNEEALSAYIPREPFLDVIHRLNFIIDKPRAKEGKGKKHEGHKKNNKKPEKEDSKYSEIADQVAEQVADIVPHGQLIAMAIKIVTPIIVLAAATFGKKRTKKRLIKYLNEINEHSADLMFVLSKNYRGQGFALSIEVEAAKVKFATEYANPTTTAGQMQMPASYYT